MERLLKLHGRTNMDNVMNNNTEQSRRNFLLTGSALGAGLFLASSFGPGKANAQPRDWKTSIPPDLPADWEWDTSITDFTSLKENIYRYKQRTGPEISAGTLPVFSILGDMAKVKDDVRDEYIQKQLPNGLFPSTIETFQLYPRSFMSLHQLFIWQRDDMSGCIHLGKKPPYSLKYIASLLENPQSIIPWIESLPWEDPWPAGNLDMDLAYAMAFEWKIMGNPKVYDALQVWFDWHDNHFDPDTGFWDPMNTGNLFHAMAGAMHQYGIYFMFNHEIPYPEKAIEATASLQQHTGLFSPYYYSHNCADIDAVFMLANLYNKYKVKEKLVRNTLDKAFEPNLKCFIPEGGAVSRAGMDKEASWWSTWCRISIVGWSAQILDIDEFKGPWEFLPRHPFICNDAGASLPDWTSAEWVKAAGWPVF
jgi:hypothetical protein